MSFYTPGNANYNPIVPGNAYYNPFVPGNTNYNPTVPGNAYYNAFVPGNPSFNPTVPGNPSFNPFVSGNAGSSTNVMGVYMPGGGVGSPAPVIPATVVNPYADGTGTYPVTVPLGGYVTIVIK
jgi:hypothetical protein